MIIKNFVLKDDGSVSFESEMTAEENASLIEYAVVSLINSGHINLNDEEEGQMDLYETQTDNKELH